MRRGLRYAEVSRPGFRRLGRPGAWKYVDRQGKNLRAAPSLGRIRALAIPPAWTEVWICPSARGHIQATGRDARGRRQYRYHEAWRQAQEQTKFHRTLAFGRVLPRIRATVARDLRRPILDRRKVLAAVVRLLETTLVRVGNETYAKQNRSYGLTTLRRRHVRFKGGGAVEFHFRGKSGRFHRIDFDDPRLARIIRRLEDLPGQHLFHFRAEDGRVLSVTADHVNAYLREIAGEEFSAKDFRTWAGTVLAALALGRVGQADSQSESKRRLAEAVAQVAGQLGNTPAICRKSYIHPELIGGYLDGSTRAWLRRLGEKKARSALRGLSAAEWAVMSYLGRHRRAVPAGAEA
ncbi:MAG TPA: DNA topoisomerase IB [Opitutaceae bacterium]|jgi:DNA topoisomerase-1